jgi:pyruvate/2-oxoglutarate dehydrogenase complex dihydrolipoamide dehydrogenase (E3) component
MDHEADVVLVGVGTGGEDLALRLLGAGLDVVGVEPKLIGGECAYWACLPSKLMIRAANLLAEAHRVNGAAGTAEVTPDWGLLASRVRAEVTGGWDDATAVARFEGRGGTLVRGYGRLVGPRTVAVGEDRFTARRAVVLATGSQPAIPPIPGLADVGYWTTHDVIAAETLPASVIVLGGGTVGCELGQVLARFGAEVTIVEQHDRLLPAEEPEASDVVAAALTGEGIAVHTGSPVEHVSADEGPIAVTTADGTVLRAERLLVATGRTIDVAALGLDVVGVDASVGRVPVDGRCRVAEGVWALGDVTGTAMFTHVALHQAGVVANDILGLEPAAPDDLPPPRATFTDPEVAAVGLTEAAAREQGMTLDVVVKQLPATFRGWLHGPGNTGVFKLVVDRDNGVLVGATAVGPEAGETLSMLALAVHARLPLDSLRSMIYAFPTFHGGIGEAIGGYARGLVTVLDPDFDPLVP